MFLNNNNSLMLIYTSVTCNYIPKARVLAKSVKKFHPDWFFILVLADSIPSGFDLVQEPFDEILTLEQLPLPNLKSWTYGHTVVELCTAVKGSAAEYFAKKRNHDKIMYLDPDIKVFNSLEPLNKLLDKHDILLTPHMLDSEDKLDAIIDNEICSLKHGIFNLGFFAAKTSGQGLDFILWWANRLYHFCTNDIPNGLFTDQRWCDLAPVFFDRLYIVRDRGYNVATWNIFHRPLSRNNENILLAGSKPLRFYHFTGYDSGEGLVMLNKYAADQVIASEIWDEYRKDLENADHGHSNFSKWKYDYYDNGKIISVDARSLYRSRDDLKKAFPDPFSTNEPSYISWYSNHEQVSPPPPIHFQLFNLKSWQLKKFYLSQLHSIRKRIKKYLHI